MRMSPPLRRFRIFRSVPFPSRGEPPARRYPASLPFRGTIRGGGIGPANQDVKGRHLFRGSFTRFSFPREPTLRLPAIWGRWRQSVQEATRVNLPAYLLACLRIRFILAPLYYEVGYTSAFVNQSYSLECGQ